MVSGSMFVVDHDLQSAPLLKFLCFDTPVSIVTLATQLISFARLYEADVSSNGAYIHILKNVKKKLCIREQVTSPSFS
jgi:hypothetical protein